MTTSSGGDGKANDATVSTQSQPDPGDEVKRMKAKVKLQTHHLREAEKALAAAEKRAGKS